MRAAAGCLVERRAAPMTGFIEISAVACRSRLSGRLIVNIIKFLSPTRHANIRHHLDFVGAERMIPVPVGAPPPCRL